MPWNFEMTGTPAAVTTALNALTGANAAEASVLSNLVTNVTGVLATMTNQARVKTSGYVSGALYRVHAEIDPVQTIVTDNIIKNPA